MNVHGHVPIKLYLQNKAVGQRLLTPDHRMGKDFVSTKSILTPKEKLEI